jgi:hypothetical protein
MFLRLKVIALVCLALCGGLASRADAEKVCIVSVSKDLCKSSMSGGNWSPVQCVGPKNVKCTTLGGTGVAFASTVKTAGTCDEAKELDGNLRTVINIDVRKHAPFNSQGSYEGKFDLIQSGQIIASGSLSATLAAGTHRLACEGKCGKECEKCYDASFNTATKTWTIGTEGIMDGRVSQGVFKGCKIRWSFQGKFTAKGDKNGPIDTVTNSWPFCGNLDGVLECPCG